MPLLQREFLQRELEVRTTKNDKSDSSSDEEDEAADSRVLGYSAVLNALDGALANNQGLTIIMTTNNLAKLKPGVRQDERSAPAAGARGPSGEDELFLQEGVSIDYKCMRSLPVCDGRILFSDAVPVRPSVRAYRFVSIFILTRPLPSSPKLIDAGRIHPPRRAAAAAVLRPILRGRFSRGRCCPAVKQKGQWRTQFKGAGGQLYRRGRWKWPESQEARLSKYLLRW